MSYSFWICVYFVCVFIFRFVFTFVFVQKDRKLLLQSSHNYNGCRRQRHTLMGDNVLGKLLFFVFLFTLYFYLYLCLYLYIKRQKATVPTITTAISVNVILFLSGPLMGDNVSCNYLHLKPPQMYKNHKCKNVQIYKITSRKYAKISSRKAVNVRLFLSEFL